MSFLLSLPFYILASKLNDMAISIITDFDSIYLTSQLPEEISFETDADSLKVTIYMNNNIVFSSDYYPYYEEVIVRDIRSLVEAFMEERRLCLGTMKIEAAETVQTKPDITYDDDGNIHYNYDNQSEETVTETIDNIKVVYSRFKTTDESSDFLSSYFLTNRKSALVPKSGQLKLSNYTRANASGSNKALIYYSRNANPGVVSTYRNNMSTVQSTTEKIVTATLTYRSFKQIVEQALGINCKVHGVEYQIGDREFNIFFTDEEPTDVFSFYNAFNIEEHAYLFGATTIKTEIERSEAVCGEYTQFYDEKVKTKYEVETAPLTIDEAKWLNQMLTSNLVKHGMEDGTFEDILISDITSEVSNSDKDLIRLKFSWKYADGNEWI